ncbi:MAG TPA: response regulator [Thermoanaerobaculia bacterium]|jgi:PAS domain S-box-containing protein|nr:response regulator [Thermoanaerobaculia bacterium]
MTAGTVLVVEDNPITRKMLRLTLESEGCTVLEAGDAAGALAAVAGGAPDLVLLDYVLPDSDGLTLLAELRRRLDAPELPALLVTGMVSRLDELRQRGGAAVHVLAKPVEPATLIELARAHLAAPEEQGDGRRVLVVDDEPLNLKLAVLRLRQAGYQVETAASGPEALAKARRQPPDAVLSDALMPGMDGFAFCLELRRDPLLAALPVVLTSSAYVDEADQQLARSVGADALVLRSPDFAGAIAALGRSLAAPKLTTSLPAATDAVSGLHRERLQVQLERERARNEVLLRQTAIQATALSVIRGLSQALADPRGAPRAVTDVLVHCLDAAGLSTGLMYLTRDGELALEAHFGIPVSHRAAAAACFGEMELVRAAIAKGDPLPVSAAEPPDRPAARFLRGLGLASALFVPFAVLGRGLGVLVLASDHHDLGDEAWIGFARSLAAQFGQTVALGQSLERLAASESRHRMVMEQAHDAILILELSYRILEANREAERVFGRPRAELIGRHYDDFVVEEERDDVAACRRRLIAESVQRTDDRHFLRPDGTRFGVEVSAALVRVGESGEPIVISILRDTSERRRLEAELQQAQKMESLGRLAGGVAHDFNNMLGVINGYAELLLARRPDDQSLHTFATEILHAGQRAAGLTRQLLAFSRRQILQPRILHLNRVVVDVERMLRRVIGEDVELVTDLAPELPEVEADPGQLEQVLLNLAVNARDAMPRGGRITLTTRQVDVDEEAAAADPGLRIGQYVLLSVRDTGHGIPPEVHEHLFEPFFTTKEMGKGTGLGLATVLGIVGQSGGHVHAVPGLESGACFEVYLPRAQARAEAPAPTAPAQPARGNETVLLVEDEPALRALVRQLLGAGGYTVIEAADATAALQVSAAHQGAIDLLLTDVVLPGRSGTELAAELTARRPAVKVLYMSGYTDDRVVRNGPLEAGATVLQKPFDAMTLARKVREALGSRPRRG